MTEYTSDNSFAVYLRPDYDVYSPYRNRLEELGYPRAGHMAKINKVSTALFIMSIEWFMGMSEKEQKEFLQEVAGDSIVFKQSKWYKNNAEKIRKYKKEWRQNKMKGEEK